MWNNQYSVIKLYSSAKGGLLMGITKSISVKKYIFLFIIAVIIPTILLTALVQINFINELYENTKKDLCKNVEDIKYHTDRYHKNLSEIADYFYMNEDFYVSSSEYDYFRYREIKDKLFYISSANTLLYESAVYFPEHKYIFSNRSSYELRYFLISYEVNTFNEKKLYEYLNNPKEKTILYAKKFATNEKYIIYFYPTFNTRKEHLHTLIFIISENSYKNIIKSSVGNNISCVYISDQEGNLVSSFNNDPERPVDFYKDIETGGIITEYMDTFINSTNSDFIPLSFTLVIRQSEFSDSIMHLKKSWINIIIVTILISIMVAIMSGVFSYLPIIGLKSRAEKLYKIDTSSSKNKVGDYQFLTEAMEYIGNKNILLQNSLDEINEYVILRFINSYYRSDMELQQLGKFLGISIDKCQFQVLLIKNHAEDGYRQVYKSCLDILPADFKFLISKKMYDNFITIILIDDLDEANSYMNNTPIIKEFEKIFELSYGSIGNNAHWISMSFVEALFNIYSRKKISQCYSISLADGNYELAKYHLQAAIDYIEEAPLEEATLLTLEIILATTDTYRKVCPEINIVNLPDTFTLIAQRDQDFLVNLLENEIGALIDRLSLLIKDHHQDIYIEMIAYLKENYRNRDFSLQEMADCFKMSTSVLSRSFSDYSGSNIIDYVTDLRMKMAIEMLITSDLNIKEIALEVGYYSSNSFIRRFKQIVGISPGKYREANKNIFPANGIVAEK